MIVARSRGAAALILFVAATCSGSDGAGRDDAAAPGSAGATGPAEPGEGGAGGAGGDRGGTAGAGAAPKDCFELRSCVYRCKADMACAARCVAQSPATAQAKFKALEDCSKQACPTQATECRCSAECLFPSACAELLDECNDLQDDDYCAEYCF